MNVILDGQSLLLEEVWERVPRSHRDALEGKWSFITQTDHPILGHPVFHIHPCNTATMMRNLLTGELDVKGHQYVTRFNLPMGRSPGFASTAIDIAALFRLGFPVAPIRKILTRPKTVTRRVIMQKARRHTFPKGA